MPASETSSFDNQMTHGNICVLNHSFFSDVIRIECTQDTPKHKADELSKKSPGEYNVVYHTHCHNPAQIKENVQKHLTYIQCVNDFFEASPEQVIQLIKRETMRIPALNQ